jgi:hypothetical protein
MGLKLRGDQFDSNQLCQKMKQLRVEGLLTEAARNLQPPVNLGRR